MVQIQNIIRIVQDRNDTKRNKKKEVQAEPKLAIVLSLHVFGRMLIIG